MKPLRSQRSGLWTALCLQILMIGVGCGSVGSDKLDDDDPFNPGGRPDGGSYGSGSGGMTPMQEMCEEAARRCPTRFSYKGAGDETTVELRSSWNDNFARGVAMKFDGKEWAVSDAVPWKLRVQYKFRVVDKNGKESWIPDPQNPLSVDDGFGGKNSVLENLTCDAWKCVEQVPMCGGPPKPGMYDWRDAVLYFVFVDRFNIATPPGATPPIAGIPTPANWQGGNWRGVTEKINAGYFNDLGVNALWLTVPMDNTEGTGIGDDNVHRYTAYHGYWPADLERPEARFGTTADLKELVSAAHAKGIRVLIDYAMNHVHSDAQLYKTHMNDGWFNPLDIAGKQCICGSATCPWDGPTAETCWFREYLPDFNFKNDAARKYSVDNALKWMKDYDLDGMRLDAVKHIDMKWLTDLRDRLTTEFEPAKKQHAYLVGETFTGDMGLIRRYIDPCTKLDGQFDFPLRANLIRVALMRQGRMQDLESFMKMNDGAYGTAVMSTFIGNHDVVRSIHYAEDGKPGWIDNEWNDRGKDQAWSGPPGQPANTKAYERMGVALTLLMTNRGVPLLYYGDEVGLAGAGDPDNRRFMQWSGYNAGQALLLNLTKKLGEQRAKHAALRRGTRTTREIKDDAWAYEMADGADKVYVLVNRGDTAQTLGSLPAGALRDQLSGEVLMGPSVSVPARGVRLLTP